MKMSRKYQCDLSEAWKDQSGVRSDAGNKEDGESGRHVHQHLSEASRTRQSPGGEQGSVYLSKARGERRKEKTTGGNARKNPSETRKIKEHERGRSYAGRMKEQKSAVDGRMFEDPEGEN